MGSGLPANAVSAAAAPNNAVLSESKTPLELLISSQSTALCSCDNMPNGNDAEPVRPTPYRTPLETALRYNALGLTSTALEVCVSPGRRGGRHFPEPTWSGSSNSQSLGYSVARTAMPIHG